MITLPLPPSINATYRFGKGKYPRSGKGNFYKSDEAKDWQTECEWLLKSQWKKKPYVGKVYVGVHWFFKRERDIDGGLKILLDLFTKRVYEDDKQVHHVNMIKYQDKKNPRVEIEIQPML